MVVKKKMRTAKPLRVPKGPIKEAAKETKKAIGVTDVKQLINELIRGSSNLDKRVAQLASLNSMIEAQNDYMKRYILRQDLFMLGLKEALEKWSSKPLHPRFQEELDLLEYFQKDVTKIGDSLNLVKEQNQPASSPGGFLRVKSKVSSPSEQNDLNVINGERLTSQPRRSRSPSRSRQRSQVRKATIGSTEPSSLPPLCPPPFPPPPLPISSLKNNLLPPVAPQSLPLIATNAPPPPPLPGVIGPASVPPIAKNAPPPPPLPGASSIPPITTNVPPPPPLPSNGGPPPPPPLPGFLNNAKNIENMQPATVTKSEELWPKEKRTVRLRWDPVAHCEIQRFRTIWNDPSNERPEFSTEERELLQAEFEQLDTVAPRRQTRNLSSVLPTPVQTPKTPITPKATPKPKSMILSNSRQMQIAMPLKKLLAGIDMNLFFKSLTECNGENQMNPDVIESLLSAWPTHEEVKRQPEIKQICQFVVVAENASSMLKRATLATERLENGVAAANNKIIVSMLHKCLMYGNFINQGSAMAGSAGFKLTSLKSVLEMRRKSPASTERSASIAEIMARFCDWPLDEIEDIIEKMRATRNDKLSDAQCICQEQGASLRQQLSLAKQSKEQTIQKWLPSLEKFMLQQEDLMKRIEQLKTEEQKLQSMYCTKNLSLESIFLTLSEGLSLYVVAKKMKKPTINSASATPKSVAQKRLNVSTNSGSIEDLATVLAEIASRPPIRSKLRSSKRMARLRTPKTLAPRFSIDREAIYQLLHELANENEEFFSKTAPQSKYAQTIVDECIFIRENTAKLKDVVDKLQDLAPQFDFDKSVPGNGFRSLVCICDTVVLQLVSQLRVCCEMRTSLMFRIAHSSKELAAYNEVVQFLLHAIPQAMTTQNAMPSGFLFPPLGGDYEKYYEMLRGVEQLDSSCFYGRPLGFQFSPTCSRIFRFIGIILATYSLSWERGHGPIGSLINSGRFFLSPEQRAARIIKVTKEADIGFCKGFWNLSELGNNVPKLFLPNMAINELREIISSMPLTLETHSGDRVVIPEPSAHTGYRPVQIRVLSYHHRNGLSPANTSNQLAISKNLIFHCHGGGYVATSSKSHETYLRVWAKLLNCTIVSVEYSLAPENPFPRPTEEVLYAYAWIINNPSWTGERVCMVGDSAGGNLIVSLNLRLIQLGVKKQPDGLVPIYTPFLFQYLPSPSRLLSMMDPLLHMGVVLRCVAAYTGAYTFKGDRDNGSRTPPNSDSNGHKSLQEYVDQVQKTQRIDFSSGSQSIVSLVNLTQDASNTSDNGYSFFKKNCDEALPSTSTSANNEEDFDDSDETSSVSSVRVDADPLHIHISPSIFDDNFVNFLQRHPLTKEKMLWCEEPAIPVNNNILEGNTDACSSISNSTSLHAVHSLSLESKTSIPVSSSSNELAASKNVLLCHKRSLSQSLADTAALAAGHALDNLSEWLEKPTSAKQKLERAPGNVEEDDNLEPEIERHRRSHLLELLQNSAVPRDPLISPMYASDDMIRQLPPLRLIACHLDPLLDDTIAFARKLKLAGGTVASLDLLPHVPHGFLNFTLLSPECRDGAKLCLQRIKEVLQIVD